MYKLRQRMPDCNKYIQKYDRRRAEFRSRTENKKISVQYEPSNIVMELGCAIPKQLHDFLELDCASYKVLKKIFSARGDSMSVETKSYMLEAIRRAEKRETNEGSENDEFSL